MEDMNEPARLWQDKGASPELRAALRAGREEKAGVARLAAIAAGLGAAGLPVAQAAGVSMLAIGAKIAMAVVVVGGLGVPAYFVLSQRPAPIEAQTSATAGPVVVPSAMPSTVAAPVLPRPEPVRVPPVVSKAVANVPLDVSPLAESRWLEEVRERVLQNPRQALERLIIYRKRFANPVLEEEAALLNIEALVALGRKRQAFAEGERFGMQHPSSPHRPRLERLLNDLR
jgi:hypothetical protein